MLLFSAQGRLDEEPRRMKSTAASGRFRTTRWSMVRRAVGSDDVGAREALATLCEGYWYPIYAFIRRSGKSVHDAEDLTQSFFARILEKGTFAAADETKGKLRAFLLNYARNFMRDEYGRATAQKRGGAVCAFDRERAERLYARDQMDELSPDRLFQRRWALTVVETSVRLLRQEYEAAGKGKTFEALRPFLGFTATSESRYEDIALTLGVPAGNLKNQAFRLRERWRRLLFDLVADTLTEPTEEEIRAELQELQGCL
jgi:RNA polymerase sigma factor (sigma-70 family)